MESGGALPSPVRRRAVVLAAALLLLPGCTGDATSNGPSGRPAATSSRSSPGGSVPLGSSPTGRIAFHSDPGGSDDLYVMDGDGSNLVQLTDGLEAGVPPVWSPDGTRIAFVCCLPSRDRVYVVRTDGTSPFQVAQASGEVGPPTWAPDSGHLAFASYTEHRIDVVGADGSNLRTLVPDATDPSWSPDGSRIAFLSDSDGDLEIFTAAADGSDKVQLTRNRAPDYEPAWSPDGSQILFVSERDGDSEIYVMHADGSRQTNLSRSRVPDDFPAWSPDGTRVAYVSYRGGADPHTIGAGNAEIYLVAGDGSARRNLTMSPTWDGDPAWSPDGRRLVFTRRTDHGQLYIIGADGTGLHQLDGVAGAANDCCAAWHASPA